MKFIGIKSLLWNFFKKLANLNFAIFILLLIAVFSMLGTLIEQDRDISYYKIYYPVSSSNIFKINWQWIYYLGLDHVYQTWWFIFVLFIFMFSLIACTFSTQLPSLKNARRWKFLVHKLSKKNSNYSFIDQNQSYLNSITNMIYPLIASNFFVFHKKYSIYAYKGLYGRIAPVFVHFSMILTLFGSIVGFFFGFVGQEMVPNGEIFHIKNLVYSGFYSSLPVDFYARVDNFNISYYSNNSIKQFFSKVSLFDRSKKVIASKFISVNSPLIFNGLTFYQTDWQINALRIQLGYGNLIQRNLIKANMDNKICWLCSFPLDSNKQIFFILFNLNESIFVCSLDGSLIDIVTIGKTFYINNTPCSIQNIMTSTGLQVKLDPGVFGVYLGFFIMMLSTVLSYLSYSQIWLDITKDFVKVMGSTNRAMLFFEKDIYDINYHYNLYTFSFHLSFNHLINQILK